MQIKTLSILLASALSMSAFAASEKFTLDSNHTFPSFEVSHLGFSITRGYFQDTSGSLELDRAAKSGKLEAIIKTGSVISGPEKLGEHLKSKDFFNAAEFPTATLKAEAFKFEGENPVEAQGSLTMLGVSKAVTLKITPMKCDMRMGRDFVCGADVTTTIKRSEWGMSKMLPFVGDEVKIAVQVEAVKQK